MKGERLTALLRFLAVSVFFLALLVHPSGLVAQDPAQMTNPLNIGLPENGVFSGSDFDQVQTNNGNLHIEIPLWSASGRGLPMYLKFVFNNTAGFYATERCPLQCFGTIRLSSGMGETLANPAKYHLVVNTSFQSQCGTLQSISIYNGLALVDPEGTKHHFVPDQAASNGTTCFSPIPNGLLYTDDGSGWMLKVDPATGNPAINGFHWDAIRKDGTEVQAISNASTGIDSITVIDPNGNQLKYDGSVTPGVTTDTLGRTMTDPVFNASTNQWEITYSDSGGTPRKITFTTIFVSLASHLCPFLADDFCTEYTGGGNMPAVITLPNGLQYSFTYVQNDYGEPQSVTLPTGGQISWTYAISPIGFNLQVTSRTVVANGQTSVWKYGYGALNGASTTTVTDPALNDTRYSCQILPPAQRGGTAVCQTTKVEQFSGSASTGTLLKTVDTAYDSSTLMVLPIRSTTTWAQGNLVTKNETDWDSFATGLGIISWKNALNQREYAYGIGTPGLLVRTTSFNYLHLTNATYRNKNIADLVTSKIVKDGSGSPVSQTQITYDGSALSGTAGVPNHDYTRFSTSNTTRGNVTRTSRWVNTTNTWLNTDNTYNDLGHVLSTTDPGLHQMAFSYTDSWSGTGCGVGTNTQAFLTQTTAPDTVNQQAATVHHRLQRSYYPCTGQTQSTRDENDILALRTGTTYAYELMLRPVTVTPNVGGTSYSYGDTPGSISVTETKQQISSPVQNIVHISHHDDLGRVVQAQLVDGADGDTFVDTAYDLNGRAVTASNPHRAAGSATDGTTTTQYDALNRPTKLIPPDGSSTSDNVTTSYGAQTSGILGLTTTVTDEAGNQRMSVTDALGRLVDVWEPDPVTGSLAFETTYTYDAIDNLLRVDQKGGAASSSWRTRTFVYDSLSRLRTATNPESGQISWTYDPDSNVLTKTDARNVVITYSYDQLHRLTGKTYSNGDPAVSYFYDQTSYNGLTIAEGMNRRTGMSDGSGATAWTYNSMGWPLTEKRKIGTVTKNVSYVYNLDGSVSTMTYPGTGKVITLKWNPAGRQVSARDVGGAINYATAATYAPQGAPSTFKMGASINAALTYDNRLQPVQMFFGTNTPPAMALLQASTCTTTVGNIMQRIYDFANGTADNGNVQTITNCRDTTGSRTQHFTYDKLNRISQASSGSLWGEQFVIDPWGNLTNKNTLGTLPNPEPLNAAPATVNNQLNGFGYDVAGNLTLNGNTAYAYDAENRIANTSGFTYFYDGDGKRVKKCTTGVPANTCATGATGTIYFTGMGSDAIAENSLTGVNQEEFIFFNGKRIARRDVATNAVFYYFSDHLGSASVIATATGVVQEESDYYPYGGERVVTGTDPNNYKFTGKERDLESTLDEFGARHYASNLGRFMTPDWAAKPITVPYANFGNPQSLNLYSYVQNNPTTVGDPDGHDPGLPGPDPSGLGTPENCPFCDQKKKPPKAQNQSKSWWASLTGALAVGVARISPAAARKLWEAANPGQKVPFDTVRNRFQDMAHILARTDGGKDVAENLKPQDHGEHIAEHVRNGDFVRWAARARDAVRSGAEEVSAAIKDGARDSAEAASEAAAEVVENPGEAIKEAATAAVEAIESGEIPPP